MRGECSMSAIGIQTPSPLRWHGISMRGSPHSRSRSMIPRRRLPRLSSNASASSSGPGCKISARIRIRFAPNDFDTCNLRSRFSRTNARLARCFHQRFKRDGVSPERDVTGPRRNSSLEALLGYRESVHFPTVSTSLERVQYSVILPALNAMVSMPQTSRSLPPVTICADHGPATTPATVSTNGPAP